MRRQVWIDAICGNRDTGNIMRHSGWSGGVRSTMGYWLRGSTRPISSSNCSFRQRAVIVGDEQEPAFQQVLPQPLHLELAEPRRSGILHERERTLKQPIVGQPDDDCIGNLLSAVRNDLDANLRQLGEPHAEIDVCARVIRAPPLFLPPVAREHHATEVEAAVVARGGRKPRGRTAIEVGKDALRVSRGDAGADDANDDDQCPDQPPAARLHAPSRVTDDRALPVG